MKKLSFEEIKANIFGALSVTKEDDGIHFYKCTEKQIQAWNNLSEGLKKNALGTTGIRFDFITNSEHIRFSTSSGNKFEVWVNGLLKEQILMDDLNDSGRVADIELGSGKKRVMIAFPSHSIGVLKFFEIDKNSYIKPSRFSKKMLFLGDSITQGWESNYDTLSYAYRTAMHFDADFVIQGVGGGSYHKTTFDLDINYEPDIVIVAFGTNDYFSYHNLDLVISTAKEYLSLVSEKYGNKRVVVITPIWRADMNSEELNGNFIPIREGIEKVALDLGFEVADGFKMVPHIKSFFADNYLHPNDNGFAIYADNLIKTLYI